jgi:hypothetical protein
MAEKQRKSTKLKTEIVLERLRGEPLEVITRKYKISASEIEGWTEQFVRGGAGSLRTVPKSFKDLEMAQAKRVIAEQAIEIDILKKRNHWVEERRKNSSKSI